jgi:hypothetical protein
MLWLLSAYANAASANAEDARRINVTCQCGSQWSRVISRTAHGTGSTRAKAEREARQFLEGAFRQPLDMACPACGQFDSRVARRRRGEVWMIPFCLAVVWLSLAGFFGLFWTVLAWAESYLWTGVAIFGLNVAAAIGLLKLRSLRQRRFDAELRANAETRRSRLHDPLHAVDVLGALAEIRGESPEALDRTASLFAALFAGGGWSAEAALAEALRRCLSESQIPPSLPGQLQGLKRYGEMPAVDAWLGFYPLR